MSDRNRALWSGFTVTLPGGNLFFTGATGWGDGSSVTEAAQRGRPRLALIAVGAFRPRALMSGNHLGPDAAVDVFKALRTHGAIGVNLVTFLFSRAVWTRTHEVM